MKTPREILFARHKSIEPRLDAMRLTVLADETNTRERTRATGVSISAWLSPIAIPWRELILAQPRLWAGLALVWLVLLLANICQRDPVSIVTGQPVRSPAMAVNWQLQQHLMSEVLADRSTSRPMPVPAESDRPGNASPRPRTENCRMAAG
jgi:hypothetical protein